MDTFLLLKAGFSGFAISVGSQMLVFYLAGGLLHITRRYFSSVFLLAGIFSFLLADLFLYYKISASQDFDSQFFPVGCIGGWVGGIFFGLTQMNRLLRTFLR